LLAIKKRGEEGHDGTGPARHACTPPGTTFRIWREEGGGRKENVAGRERLFAFDGILNRADEIAGVS